MNGIGFDSLVWAQSCSINISKKQKKNSAIAIHLYLVVLLRSPTWWIQLSYPRTRSFSCKILTSILTPQIAIPLTTPALVVGTLAAFTYRICLYLPWHTWTLLYHTVPSERVTIGIWQIVPQNTSKPITTWCGLVFPRFLLLFFLLLPRTPLFLFQRLPPCFLRHRWVVCHAVSTCLERPKNSVASRPNRCWWTSGGEGWQDAMLPRDFRKKMDLQNWIEKWILIICIQFFHIQWGKLTAVLQKHII